MSCQGGSCFQMRTDKRLITFRKLHDDILDNGEVTSGGFLPQTKVKNEFTTDERGMFYSYTQVVNRVIMAVSATRRVNDIYKGC